MTNSQAESEKWNKILESGKIEGGTGITWRGSPTMARFYHRSPQDSDFIEERLERSNTNESVID